MTSRSKRGRGGEERKRRKINSKKKEKIKREGGEQGAVGEGEKENLKYGKGHSPMPIV